MCKAKPPLARPRCLSLLLADLATFGEPIRRLTLESVGPVDHRDRETILRCRQELPTLHDVPYEQMLPHEEPLLALSDVIAWAYGAGGDWRSRAEQLIDKIAEVPP